MSRRLSTRAARAQAATQLPSTFGIRLKYATVYAVKIYDYMKQVPFNANAGLPAQDPVPISGTFSWNWATGYVNQAYSGAAAGPVDFYVSFNKNDSISGATRTGASASYSTTGTYANGTPWWCGPAYNATPCYTYEGDPGYVQLRRLDADVALTSDSSQVNTGTNVTFTITSAPRYVEGQEMPITIDTVSWIIDPDTLGGDFSDEQLLNACSFSGGPSLKTCTRTINSAGTLRVIGGVSGKRFQKDLHIGRRDAYPIITATKYYVNAGQRDTFNVRMSDGSAFTMWQWSWLTDQGTAGSTTLGCNWQLPCPNAIIMETGYVRAKVNHGGRFKWTRAHITVGPPPRLALTATPSIVLTGDTVVFTAGAPGAPASVTQWRYNNVAVAGCGPGLTCRSSIVPSGVMWAYGVVDGRPDSAQASVTTTDSLLLRCSPQGDTTSNVVVRGATVSCIGHLRSGRPFSVMEANASMGQFGFVPIPGSIADAQWESTGKVALSTTVQVIWTADGHSGAADAAFTVQPRSSFPNPELPEPRWEWTDEWGDRPQLIAISAIQAAWKMTLGQVITPTVVPDFPLLINGLIGITTGPNAGLAILGSFPMQPPAIRINKVLDLSQPIVQGSFRSDQNGTDGTSTTLNDIRYCDQTDMPNILAETKRHEGVGLDYNSHVALFNRTFSSEHVGQIFEPIVFRVAEVASQVPLVVRGQMRRIVDEQTVRLHNPFDEQQQQTLTQRINCAPDVDPENP